jgi:hypothetical protein
MIASRIVTLFAATLCAVAQTPPDRNGLKNRDTADNTVVNKEDKSTPPDGAETAPEPAPPAPSSKGSFTGKIKIDGNVSFGAQIPRQISGSVMAQWSPAEVKPGSLTPIFLFSTAYGDTIKGAVTSKTSQIDSGRFDLQIRLRNAPSNNVWGPTNVNVIADEFHSFSQGVALQQGYGAGVSQGIGQLTLEGDIWALRESYFKPAPTFSSAAARLYETYTIFSSNRFVLAEDLEAVLPFKSMQALLVRGGAELTIKLGKAGAPLPFSLNVTYSDFYFRNAPKGYKQNYAKVALGIAYSW